MSVLAYVAIGAAASVLGAFLAELLGLNAAAYRAGEKLGQWWADR